MTNALHVGQSHHQPWCRIYHNPASTTECWCDSQIAVTAYKIGVAEGMAMAVLKGHVDQPHHTTCTEHWPSDSSLVCELAPHAEGTAHQAHTAGGTPFHWESQRALGGRS